MYIRTFLIKKPNEIATNISITSQIKLTLKLLIKEISHCLMDGIFFFF